MGRRVDLIPNVSPLQFDQLQWIVSNLPRLGLNPIQPSEQRTRDGGGGEGGEKREGIRRMPRSAKRAFKVF